MGILDQLKSAFNNQVKEQKPAVQNQRKLDTTPKPVQQPTSQMTAVRNAIDKWAANGTKGQVNARRKLMAEPEPPKNWYSGSEPTSSEILARIYSISETNPEQSKQLFSAYQSFSQDPSSPLYNPYTTSTNKAITELQNLGFDMSGGVTDKWLQDNAYLMNYYRMENGNSPLAPAKKSTAEQDAAYWYYKVLSAEETTQKAETEWQALQDEIKYWAGRTDRNYSDDEILAKINWSNYKTLTGMDEDKAKGIPTVLNRSVGYSQDALKGVIWAARNGSTGDSTMDSVNAVLGRGKGWDKNNTITEKLDPTSAKYSPYSVGSTLDEAALYFGVQEFSKDWLEKNRAMIASDDLTEQKMYQKVYNAEQTTLKAEQELADLRASMDKYFENGNKDPETILRWLADDLDDCKTLQKMDESRKSGDIMATTRAVDYRWEDIEAEVRKRCDEANGKVSGGQFVQNLAKKFKTNIKALPTNTAVQKWRDAFVESASKTIMEMGTDEEKIAFANGGSADYGAFLGQIIDNITSEDVDTQAVYDDAVADADAYVKENYLDAYGVVTQYEEAQRQYEEAMKKLEELSKQPENIGNSSAQVPGLKIAAGGGSDMFRYDETMKAEATGSDGYDAWYAENKDTLDDMARQMSDNDYSQEEIDSFLHQFYRDTTYGVGYTEPDNVNVSAEGRDTSNAELNYWRAEAENAQARMQELQAQYEEKSAILKEAQENYEAAQRIAAQYHIDVSDVGGLMKDFEVAWQLGSEYRPTDWNAYTAYEQSAKDNYDHAEISKQAREDRANYTNAIAQLEGLLERLGVTRNDNDDPFHMIQNEQLIPDEFVDNINRYIEYLEREQKAATYWLLQDNKDFAEQVENARKAITDEFNSSFFNTSSLKTQYQIANPNWEPDSVQDINTYVDQMTDSERNTYLYLYATAGPDAAKEYYDYLTDESYGVLTTRTSAAFQNAYSEMTKSGWLAGLGMNVMDVLSSPMRLYGTAYAAIAGLSGREINPNSKYFAASTLDSAVTSATNESIDDAFGKDSAWAWLAKLGYSSAKSIAESMYTGYLFGGLSSGSANAIISNWLGAVPMAAEAVSSAVQDAKANGATNEQALAIGGITFFAESVSEAITIGNLKEAMHMGSDGGKQAFMTLLKNAFTEEAPGEMFNEALEAAADYWIMGDNSKYEQEVQRLMHEEGLKREEAEDRALAGIFGDVLYAGLSGALGGLMGGGVEALANKHAYNAAARAIQKQSNGKLTFEQAKALLDTYMNERQGTEQNETQTEPTEQKSQEKAQGHEELPTPATVEEGEVTQQPVNQTEQTTETPAEITEQPVNQTEETPAEITPEAVTPEANQWATNAAATLQSSLRADLASKTAAIAGALAPQNGQNVAAARTAAQHLAVSLGSNKAVKVTRDIMLAIKDYNMNGESVQVAVTTAALNEGGQAHTILADMAQNGVTQERIDNLVQEAAVEFSDTNVQSEMEATVRENEIAEREKALVADGALNGLKPMEQAVTDAKNKRRGAQSALTKQVNKFNVAKQANQEAQARFRTDPGNAELKAAAKAARGAMKAQAEVVNEYKQRLVNADQSVAQAEDTLKSARAQAMNDLRRQVLEDMEREQLDVRGNQQYNENEVNENAVQPGSVAEGEADNTRELAPASGRDDGRGDNAYARQGAGEETAGRGAEGVAESNRQVEGRVPARLLKKQARQNLTDKGVTDLHLQEESNQQRFSDALSEAKESNDHGAYVDNQSVEQLEEKGAKMVVSEDGLAGAAVGTKGKEKGNIFAVFKNKLSQAKHASADLIIQAIAQGGNKLDCYNGNLSTMYQNLGMIPVARVAFNEEFMPDGWNVERDDHPDVVFWMHNGDSADTVAEKYGKSEDEGGYHMYSEEEINALPLFDDVTEGNETQYGYDRAWDYRDQLLAEQQAKRESASSEISALKGQRTNAINTETTPSGKPKKSPYQVAIDLADKLGIGHSFGTRKMDYDKTKAIPKNVLGYYRNRIGYINVRSKEAGNFITTMHEIWHGLGERLNMTGTDEMISKLDPVFFNSYKAEDLPGEAFAEFGWNYVMGEEQARNFAGDAFVYTFERAAKNAGLFGAVKQAQKDMQMWLNASINDRFKAVVRDANEANKPDKGIRHLLDSLVDETSVADEVDSMTREQTGEKTLSVDQSLRKMALMKNFSSKVANSLLNNKLTDPMDNTIGDSLAKRLEDAGVTGKDFDDLVQYWLFKHSFDRDAQGKPVFDVESFPAEARQQFVDDIEANHPEIVKGEQALQDFRKEFLQAWLVDTGFLTQKAFDKMNEMYEHYAPTQRIMDQNGRGRRGSRQGFTIHRATGGTQDIINPIDSYVSMVTSVVNMVRANQAAQTFEKLFSQNKGMGVFAKDVTEDMKLETVNTENLQERVANIIYGKAKTAITEAQDDILQRVLKAIGTEQSQMKGTGKVDGPNILTVTRADGTKGFYEIYNTDLYNLLASQRDNIAGPIAQKVAKLTRAMSALTTGSNPVFAIRNFMRDFQNSVNYGSWANNYAWGMLKWLRAAYDVWQNKGEYSDYMALGGGGWNYIDTGTKKGASEYRGDLCKGYNTRNAGAVAKTAATKLWHAITFERLNEIVEQTSRYVEYKYGKHDLSTGLGRMDAFLASQDVTVDFARTGNGKLAAELKAFIPFFGASMQGVYRTGRMFTEAERDRAPARFFKTVINTALTSALCSAFLLRDMDDDDKEAFLNMSDDLKAGHFYIPNFAKGILGQAPLIRIPVAQDPLSYAVHGLMTDYVWKHLSYEKSEDGKEGHYKWEGTTDEMATDILSIANTILDNLTPINSTILDPLISMKTNVNWYGGKIVPSRLEDLPATDQFTEETPSLFVNLGRTFGVSPMKLQYAAEQYTGFLGQMAIPAMSYDKNTGEVGGVMAAINAARKKLTSDPLVSNDIVSSFYDGASLIEGVKKVGDKGLPQNDLRRGLSDEELTKAYEEAKEMLAKGGILYETKALINDCYGRINEINANQTLSDEDKYKLTSDIRREMIGYALDAQEAIGTWKANYVTGRNFVTDALFAGGVTHIPDAYESMSDSFKADMEQDYMQKAYSVWEATGKDSALPHPNTSFEYTPKGGTKVKYEIGEEHWADWEAEYKRAYEGYMAKNVKNWDDLDNEQKLEALKKAHDAGHTASKNWYMKDVLHIK